MEKTITIRGVGNASAAPDTIELSVTLLSCSADYHMTMSDASNKHAHIVSLLAPLGFTADAFKTLRFTVDTNYEDIPDGRGGYQRVFRGYRCDHELRLVFPFSMQRLAQILSYLARSEAAPELSIRFTLKNGETLRAKALVDATANAYRSASVLTKASRTSLGEIIRIEYGDARGEVYSPTAFGGARKAVMYMSADISIQPDDVTARETVDITWVLQ